PKDTLLYEYGNKALFSHPIRDDSHSKCKSKTPIKDPKPITSLDSPPVKKSRRRVAWVIEESSDEENEEMDTVSDTPMTNGRTSGHSENETSGKMERDESEKQEEVNEHVGDDEKMSSPSSGHSENETSGKTERDESKKQKVNGQTGDDEEMSSPSSSSEDNIPKRKTARKHMRKRKAPAENVDAIVKEERDDKDSREEESKKTEKADSEEESKKDVRSPVPKKTKMEVDTLADNGEDNKDDSEESEKQIKVEINDLKKKKKNKKDSISNSKNDKSKSGSSIENKKTKRKTKKSNSEEEEKSTSDSDSKKNQDPKATDSKKAFSSFFSPRQATKSSKTKDEKKKEAMVKKEKVTLKLEKESNEKEDESGNQKPVDATEYNPEKNYYHPIKHACWRQGEKVPYLAIARTFQAIEETSARLKIMSTLSNFLRSVIALSPNDLLPCVYLCLNKLAPAYKGIELGIGDNVLMKAVSESTGRSIPLIKADLAEKGDLGLVAESCRTNQRTMFAPPKLTAVGVYSKLKEIAMLTGHSSMTKKVDVIKGMFVACRHSEARYLIRSLSGKLRIGLAEQSVLTSLAHAAILTPPGQEFPPAVFDAAKILSSEELKKQLEEAVLTVKSSYCELPSYDKIIPAILDHGIKELPKICYLTPGIPLKPMLAHPSKGVSEVLKRFDDAAFTCEYKYDGERAQIHMLENGEIHIYSRNQENNTTKYPDIIARMSKAFNDDVKSFIIDTEAVAWDRDKKQILPFQVLSTRKRKSYVKEPFSVRRDKLRSSFQEVEGEFMFATCKTSTNTEDIQEFLEESIKERKPFECQGTVGLSARFLIGSERKPFECHGTLKKDYLADVGDTLDLVVIGGYRGKGKRTGSYGGFLLACYDTESEEFQTICKIGTGFTDEALDKHFQFFQDHVIEKPKPYYRYDDGLEPEVWFDAVQVWEVKAADLSISPVYKAGAGQVDPVKGISLRFPRFLRIRNDKKPEEATDSSQVISKMADETEGDEVCSEDKPASKVTEYLDDVVGTNVSSLSKVKVLLDNTLKKEKELKKRLEDAKNKTPAQVQQALDDGESSKASIKDFHKQREIILEKAVKKVEKIKPLADHLSHLADQIADIERFRTYISWIQKLEAVSDGIQEHVESGLLGSAVHQFSILVAITSILESSLCENLKVFSQEMQVYWCKVLLAKLSSVVTYHNDLHYCISPIAYFLSEFEEVTNALKWPFTSLSTAPPLSTTSEVYHKLERLFILLLKLQDFKCYDVNNENKNARNEILLPIDWLLKPLRKRFRFHFYGKKQTNNIAKPEWFFTQILNWIKSHADFIHHTIQPILNKADAGFVDAKCEFIHGLLNMAVEKMEHCIPLLLTDDSLFSHFVDETLLFDQEIYNLHDYSAKDHQCLRVLTTPECLDKWVELEQKYANENLESLLSSSSAWKGKYQDIGSEVDDTKTPECAEGFVTLLTVITDRYKHLSSHQHQRRFLNVQLQLLEEFTIQLELRDEESCTNPIDPLYLSVLNAAYFVTYVLDDWSEQAIFLELHERRIVGNKTASDQNDDTCTNTGVFDEQIHKLQELKEHMMDVVVENIIKDFKTKCNVYKKERWHSLPSPKDFAVMALSSSACDWLLFLKDRLKTLELQLAQGLFSTLWQRLAQALNKVIYQKVILECHFNEGGVAQLQFDMTKHLFTLFGEYTSKPENYFK
ncbi:hypothetical protein QZH41_011566, partial [Actinostola sp. cb2023]